MAQYTFLVVVDADTGDHAARVMQERIDHSEDYGFEYHVEWRIAPTTQGGN